MKTCNKCLRELPLTSFGVKGKLADGSARLRAECKKCKKQADVEYYQNLPAEIKTKRLQHTLSKAQAAREYVWQYLSEHPCVDCGESDILFLEFDHLSDKVKHISAMVTAGALIENIQKEINKCEVRCIRCHRLITAQRGNWRVLTSGYRKQHAH